MQITIRPSSERGHANHGWLKSYHTFSFANYYDPEMQNWGSLRVINEDRVAPKTGFPLHQHREYEIFSYIINGELTHTDTIHKDKRETLKRGDIQFSTTGTGLAHSETNEHSDDEVHFLQIWVKPDTARLSPAYHTRSFNDGEKTNKLVKVVENIKKADAKETPINQDLSMSASILEPGKTVSYSFGANRKGYIHLIMSSGYTGPQSSKREKILKIGDQYLAEGDGAFLTAGDNTEILEIENISGKKAEFVLFDLA